MTTTTAATSSPLQRDLEPTFLASAGPPNTTATAATTAMFLHYTLSHTLLIFLSTDTLKCHKRILCKFGSGFTKRPFEWKSFATKETGHEEICQETVLKVDVGEKSLLVRSKGSGIHVDKDTHDFTMCGDEFPDAGHVQVYANRPGILAAMYIKCCESDLHNSAAISQVLLDYINISASYQSKNIRCPVCLHYQGSCHKNFVFCPKDTGCYDGDIAIEGGGVNANFSIKGCLDVTAGDIFKKDETLGIFSVLENMNSMTKLIHTCVCPCHPGLGVRAGALLSPLSGGLGPLR
ncbi:CD177 antigen-like [Peromyscus maniculatus bairdii]|uniref:CD177 antigen-like n=1 Tax=Peromyscus maniculatus bairdii TaxID=230844 RepID=UPI003FD10B5F